MDLKQFSEVLFRYVGQASVKILVGLSTVTLFLTPDETALLKLSV